VVDEVTHAGRSVGEAPDDAQPIHVGQGLVEDADLAKVVRLVDDGRDRGAEARRRGAQGFAPIGMA
jgi:hypothetical protein